ncbi:MAG: LAGLIDADG family homing endonuclease [Nitrososphaerales archaeon]
MKRDPAPTLDRVKAYEMVRRLVEEGTERRPATLSVRLKEAGLIVPSRMTIRRWVNDTNSPVSILRRFEPVPSEELSFFVAAWIADGWGDENDGGKRMRLKVRSRTFAEEFARCASVILSKSKPYRVWTTSDEGGTWYNVKATSLELFAFANRDLESLKETISQNPRGFLRGLFTAEGCPCISLSTKRNLRLDVGITISNTDVALLELARRLLLDLGIRTGGMKINRRAGERTNLSVALHSEWQFTVSARDDVLRFARSVGFADLTKQTKLDDGLRMIFEVGPAAAADRWRLAYEKKGRIWVRKDGTGAPTFA